MKPNLAKIAVVVAVAASAAAVVAAATAAAAMVAVAATAKSANPGGNSNQALGSNHLSYGSPRRVVPKGRSPRRPGLLYKSIAASAWKSTVAHKLRSL